MSGSIRLVTPVVDVVPRSLGPYAPRDGAVADALDALVREAARETAGRTLGETDADLVARTVVVKLEPDTHERPFASAQVLVEVVRPETGQAIYTRKVETEVRRLIQAPVPMDDARFVKTALGRATVSCLRSLFTAVADTFSGA